MNMQVAVLAAVAVLLHVPAGQGFSVTSRDSEHQLDAGDGTGMKQVSEESDVSNQDLDAGNLMLVKESVGNDLHDIRRRETRSKKRSRKRQGESGDESGMDQKHKSNEEVLTKGISDILEPQKEVIINFMKPILDRIKHVPKKPSLDNSSESQASPALSTPAPSSAPSDSDASTSSDSDASNSTNSDASNSTNSDAPTPASSSDLDASSSLDSTASNSSKSDASNSTNSDASTPSNPSVGILPVFPFSTSKCGESERHRSMSTLSLLFPDLQSNKGEQPFAFVPLTNALMRVVDQKIIKQSQSGGDLRRELHN